MPFGQTSCKKRNIRKILIRIPIFINFGPALGQMTQNHKVSNIERAIRNRSQIIKHWIPKITELLHFPNRIVQSQKRISIDKRRELDHGFFHYTAYF